MRNLSNLYVDGVVGIGTTSANAKLDVVVSSTYGGITVRGNIVPRVVFNSSNDSSNYWGIGIHDNLASQFAIGKNTSGHAAMTEYFVISGSGDVGIGTNSPSQKLHVVGNIYNTGFAYGDSHSAFTEFRIRNNENNVLRRNGSTLQLNSTDDLVFSNTASFVEAMRIKSTGNVLIGTTTDAGYKLDVAGNIRISGTNGYVYGDTTTTYLRLSNAAGSILGYSNGYIALGPSFVYNSGGVERFRIQSADGYVGIGTTSPARKLSVYQSSSSMVADFRSASGNDSFVSFSNNASTADQVRLGSSSGNLILSTNYSERLRIDAAGNVGIGTTSPSYKLDVAGNASIYDLFVIRQTSNAASVADLAADFTKLVITAGGSTGADHYLAFQTQASYTKYERARFTSGGNLLIGTTTDAGYKLDVVGSVNTNSYYQSLGTVFGRDSRQNNFITYSDSTVVSNRTLTIGNATYLNTVFPNGNVGIGTTSPGSPLTVAGRVDFQNDLRLRGTDSAANQGIARFYVDSSNSLYIDTANDGSNLFTINSSGNVGVGTTSPLAKLHVKDGNTLTTALANTSALIEGFSQSILQIASHSTGYSMIAFGDQDDGFDGGFIYSNASRYLSIEAANAERMRFTSTGNVLIGTTTDNGYLLNVNGDATINGHWVGRGPGSVSTNVVLGQYNLNNNVSGGSNTAIGYSALSYNTGNNNTAVGREAGYANTTGSIVAVGYQAGYSSITGLKLTAIGQESLKNATGNENTAVGYRAAYNTTTGIHNTALGQQSLLDNTTGSRNTSIGSAALENNTASNNTALGFTAGYSNTTGSIVAVGYEAGFSNTTGGEVTALGHQALRQTTGGANTAIGYQAAYNTTTSTSNTAIGRTTLLNNTTGSNNTAVGRDALRSSTTSSNNTAVGRDAGYNNTTGNITAFGYAAGYSNTTGTEITAIGQEALKTYTGSQSTALGYRAGYSMTTPSNNTVIGRAAAYSTTTGHSNTVIGRSALYNNVGGSQNVSVGINTLVNSTGDQNVAIGSYAGDSNTTGSNNIFIGQDSDGVSPTDSNRTFIGNSSTTSTWVGGNLLVGTTTDSGYTLAINGSAGSTARFSGSGQSTVSFNDGTYDNYLVAIGGQMQLRPQGTTILTAKTTGVGIGTTSPETHLHINGTGTTASSNQYHLIVGDDNTYGINKGGGIIFRGDYNSSGAQANFGAIRAGKANANDGNANAYLSLLYGASGVLTEGLRVDYNGNVGIGTSSPSATLHVNGGIKLSDNQFLSWNGSNTRIVGQSGYMQLQVAAVDVMRLTSSNNVLIGTTTDNGKKLQVNGDVFIKGSTSASSTKIFEVQNSNGTSIMDFRGDAYAFFGCGQGGGAASGFIFRYNDTAHVQFTGYNYGNGSGSYKPILLDTDLVGRGQGIYVNFGGTGYANPAPLSSTEFAVRGRTSDASQKVMQLHDSNNNEIFSVQNDGAVFTQGSQGWNGTVNFPTNAPGQQNLQFVNGILVNVF